MLSKTLCATGLLTLSALLPRLGPVNAEEDLRMVRGTVGIATGGVPVHLAGEGWKVGQLATGYYRIYFNDSFPAGVQSRPSVVVSGNQTAFVNTPGVNSDYFDVHITSPSLASSNSPIHFVAVGPAK